MKIKGINGKGYRLYLAALAVFAAINVLLVYNPDQFFLPMLAVPVFITGTVINYGTPGLIPVLLAGILPYIILGSPETIPLTFLPPLILSLVFLLIVKFKKGSAVNTAASALGVFAGLALRYWFLIYVTGKSNITSYAQTLAFMVKRSILSYMLTMGTEKVPGQTAVLQSLMASVSQETVLQYIPLFLIVQSVVTGYCALRCLKTFLKFSPEGYPKVSYYSELRANPAVLAVLVSAYAWGTVMSGKDGGVLPWGLLTASSGGLLIFTGMMVLSASVLHLGVTRFKLRTWPGKIFFTLPSLLIFGSDGMILFSMIDSVFDFRRLTSYGISGKIAEYAKNREEGDGK